MCHSGEVVPVCLRSEQPWSQWCQVPPILPSQCQLTRLTRQHCSRYKIFLISHSHASHLWCSILLDKPCFYSLQSGAGGNRAKLNLGLSVMGLNMYDRVSQLNRDIYIVSSPVSWENNLLSVCLCRSGNKKQTFKHHYCLLIVTRSVPEERDDDFKFWDRGDQKYSSIAWK